MKIGFIGTGKMGEALVRGIVSSGIVPPECIYASDVDKTKLDPLEELGVNVSTDNKVTIASSDIVILAVKPQIIEKVIHGIRNEIKPHHLIISIAAGVKIETISSGLPEGTRIIRVMPNIAATVGEAATAICTYNATPEDMAAARRIFDSVGRTVEVNESLMDAVTGLSGSGPAYIFMIIEALADGGVHEGLDRPTARILAAQTVLGAAKMVLENGTHTGVLKDMVTSPGGTTSRGIRVMEERGVRVAMINAVIAGAERSRELGRKS